MEAVKEVKKLSEPINIGKMQLKSFTNVYAIGDCVQARTAVEAIYEGWKIALEI